MIGTNYKVSDSVILAVAKRGIIVISATKCYSY